MAWVLGCLGHGQPGFREGRAPGGVGLGHRGSWVVWVLGGLGAAEFGSWDASRLGGPGAGRPGSWAARGLTNLGPESVFLVKANMIWVENIFRIFPRNQRNIGGIWGGSWEAWVPGSLGPGKLGAMEAWVLGGICPGWLGSWSWVLGGVVPGQHGSVVAWVLGSLGPGWLGSWEACVLGSWEL